MGGWYRDGTEICHYQNTFKTKTGSNFNTLSFEIEFEYNHDEVYFAHFFPYRYSDLQLFLAKSIPEEMPTIVR